MGVVVVCPLHAGIYTPSMGRHPMEADTPLPPSWADTLQADTLPPRTLQDTVNKQVVRILLECILVCLYMLIFGGKFRHSQHVRQLWLHKLATAHLYVSCGLELKLNREALPLTEANKQHVKSTMVTNIFTKCTRGMRFVNGKFNEWCL